GKFGGTPRKYKAKATGACSRKYSPMTLSTTRRVLYERLRAAFPDFHPEIHCQVAAGDLVTTYETYHGTHQGEFLGIPATGKKVSFYTVDAMRAVDGKLTEQPPATMKDEGLADAKAANPFRLPRLHPGICRVRIKTKLIVRAARALPRS